MVADLGDPESYRVLQLPPSAMHCRDTYNCAYCCRLKQLLQHECQSDEAAALCALRMIGPLKPCSLIIELISLQGQASM